MKLQVLYLSFYVLFEFIV